MLSSFLCKIKAKTHRSIVRLTDRLFASLVQVKVTIDDKETKQAVNAALNHFGDHSAQPYMTRAHEMDTND